MRAIYMQFMLSNNGSGLREILLCFILLTSTRLYYAIEHNKL